MSEDLFYNRDNNYTGSSPFPPLGNFNNLNMAYGSTITFKAKNISYETDNKILNTLPLGANNLDIKVNFVYHNVTEYMDSVVYIIQPYNATGLVNVPFDTHYLGQESGVMSRYMSGYFLGYDINHVNLNRSEMNIKLEITDYSPTLAWSGDKNLLAQLWSGFVHGQPYKKFDIVYSGINDNKLNNFWYCTGDHSSSALNSPTGDESMWTQNFFFAPDMGYNANVNYDVERLEWKNSKVDRIKVKDNNAVFSLNYNFSLRSLKEARAIMHFLDNKAGFRRFRYDIPLVFDAPKVMYAPEWTMNQQYIDQYNITVVMREDPLGIVPTGT